MTKPNLRWGLLVGIAAALAVSSTASRSTAGPLDRLHVIQAEEAILGLDYDVARKELAAADPADPDANRERGRLALYEGDCDGALATLSTQEILATDEGANLADIARGCARVTAATVLDEDKEHAVWIRYQDEADRSLTPLIVDTVVKARDQLTKDLGVTWPKPTRIVVVRDLLALAAMTGLPYDSARTTGTVAVAKWGRVTLLSPRASQHGYQWRDTVAHELTHLAVTRASVDRAPLWLQEGIAKREEIRWRPPGPFDDRPSPDAIAAWGIKKKIDLELDKLGPSIAMLPSADAAMVAFSEVTSFVRYFADHAGDAPLPRLLGALAARKPDQSHRTVDEALVETTGADLKAWDVRWRADLAARTLDPLPAYFGGAGIPDAANAREKVRLAELLFGRGHAKDALDVVDAKTEPLPKPFLEDPSLRYLRGRSLEALGKVPEGRAAIGGPADVGAPYAPWWAVRGRLARAQGDAATADPSFEEAIALDPFAFEPACEVTPPGTNASPAPKYPALCTTAKAAGEPDLGQD
jgi:hypothetical protein